MSINIKCPNCDAEIYIDKSIGKVICGCCMEVIDIAEACKDDWKLKPTSFLISNGELKKYLGQSCRNIHTPSGIKSIGYRAFEFGVLEVYISDGVEEIKPGAFGGPYLMHLSLPDSITTIENRVNEKHRYQSTWAINLKEMAEINPVKPVIECSRRVKELLLADYTKDERKEIEKGIEWR